MADHTGTDAAARIAWDMIISNTPMSVDFTTLPEDDKKQLIEQAAKDAASIVVEVKQQLERTDSYAREEVEASATRYHDVHGNPTRHKPTREDFTNEEDEEAIRRKQSWYRKLPFI